MEISYLGHASFLLKTRECKVVTDPFSPVTGMVFPKTAADIVTVSHNKDDHNFFRGVQGEPMVFDWPGEFEKLGVRIFGFQSEDGNGEENVIFKFEMDGIHIVHLGNLGKTPDDKLVEAIGEADIVFIPCGGGDALDAKHAFETAKKLDASVVIPMHFGTDKLGADESTQLAPVGEFLKAMGIETIQPLEKYVVKKDEIADKELEVVLLSS